MLTHPSRLYFRETRAEGAAHISFVAHLPQHLMQHDPVGTRHPACLCLTQERPEHSYMRKEFFEMSDCAAGKDERAAAAVAFPFAGLRYPRQRSEEHTSELQSLMRISYAVFCLKKKTNIPHIPQSTTTLHT